MVKPLSRNQMAWRAAQDLEEGMMYITLPVDNLPMGMYQLVSNLDGQLLTEKVMIRK